MDSILLTHGTCDAQAAIWDGVEFGHLGDQMKMSTTTPSLFQKEADGQTSKI
jgi:hypothetical protein